METNTKLILSQAPHIKNNQNVDKIMWLVILALTPSAVASYFFYGINAVLVMAVSILSAVFCEGLYHLIKRKPVTITNGSAVLTGLLLAMNVPPNFPLWMIALGSFFSIIFVKELFGGLGFNIFNPALAGRAFLMASFPAQMTTTWHKFSNGTVFSGALKKIEIATDTITSATPMTQLYDVITSATPLTALKEAPKYFSTMNVPAEQIYNNLFFSKEVIQSLAIGNIGGCIGETSAILLLLGAIFLMIKKIITPIIPIAYIGTFSIIIFAYYSLNNFARPEMFLVYHLLSGGLFLGAFFMATDMVTSPITGKGMLIFGIGCGIIASVIRLWGGYPEGVSYSILLMNAAVPLIDRWTKPKIYGKKKA